jgi:hypothetical protein
MDGQDALLSYVRVGSLLSAVSKKGFLLEQTNMLLFLVLVEELFFKLVTVLVDCFGGNDS